MTEGKFVEVVDKNDRVTGKVLRKDVHKKPQWHRSVHVWVFSSDGKLFLQKRPDDMEYYPSLWDSSVGEHVEISEAYEKAALRGLKEELGVNVKSTKFLVKKPIADKTCAEMISLFKVVFDGKITIAKGELADGKFFTQKQVQKLIAEKKTTPFFNGLFGWWQNEGNAKNQP